MNIAKYIISINEKNNNSNIRTIIIVLSSYSYKITTPETQTLNEGIIPNISLIEAENSKLLKVENDGECGNSYDAQEHQIEML